MQTIKSRMIKSLALIMMLACATSLFAQQPAFNKEEFASRRARLMEQMPDGFAVIFAGEEHVHAVKFRQYPDFLYFTGIHDPEAVLVIRGDKKEAYVFTEKREGSKLRADGPSALNEDKPAEKYGVTAVLPTQMLLPAIANWAASAKKMYLPVQPHDTLQKARGEIFMDEMGNSGHPLLGRTPAYQEAIGKLRTMLPHLEVVNVAPLIDKLRFVKTPYEIERMRQAGRVGAISMREAIKGTKPGMYEYDVEAAARYYTTRMGNAGMAFTPIVASGPNMLTWHYIQNNRQMQAGDLVLMDYGADVDGYTSDITRTWPVSGKFTPEQEKMYMCVYEASRAIINAIKPGVTTTQLKAVGREVYKKHGFEKQWMDLNEYIGHTVGMSVHDVGPGVAGFGVPITLQAGATFNVEPILEIPEKGVHIRLEDSILVTENGHENMTADVPAELDAIYALIKQQGINTTPVPTK